MKKIVCIPVFNEAHRLNQLIDNLNKSSLKNDEILFINDGSKDKSKSMIIKSNYNLISFEKNYGVGHSLMKGIEYAINNKIEIFGVLSSNGKMLPSEINELFDPIIKENYDFINGSRFLNKQKKINTPKFRKFLIILISKIISFFVNYKITDFSCGYRCFKVNCIKKLNIGLKDKSLYRYKFETLLFSKVIINRNIKFKEVGITMNYPIDKKNYTKIRPIIDWYTILSPIFFNIIKNLIFRNK